MRNHPARRPDSGGRSTVFGTRGALACEHPQAALAGIRVLDDGGNAADACVAMAACMAVLAPMATGMPRDAFQLFYDAGTKRVLGANGSGRAPRSATIEKLRERGIAEMPERGGLPVTVPGAVRLWEDAAKRLGRLGDFSRLLEPACEVAEEGFPVSYRQGGNAALRGGMPRLYGHIASRRKAPDRAPVSHAEALSPADTGRLVVLPPRLPENLRPPGDTRSLGWHGAEESEPMDARPRARIAGGAAPPRRCPRPLPHGSGAAAADAARR